MSLVTIRALRCNRHECKNTMEMSSGERATELRRRAAVAGWINIHAQLRDGSRQVHDYCPSCANLYLRSLNGRVR